MKLKCYDQIFSSNGRCFVTVAVSLSLISIRYILVTVALYLLTPFNIYCSDFIKSKNYFLLLYNPRALSEQLTRFTDGKRFAPTFGALCFKPRFRMVELGSVNYVTVAHATRLRPGFKV